LAVFMAQDHNWVAQTRTNNTIWYINTRNMGGNWGGDEGYTIIDFFQCG